MKNMKVYIPIVENDMITIHSRKTRGFFIALTRTYNEALALSDLIRKNVESCKRNDEIAENNKEIDDIIDSPPPFQIMRMCQHKKCSRHSKETGLCDDPEENCVNDSEWNGDESPGKN